MVPIQAVIEYALRMAGVALWPDVVLHTALADWCGVFPGQAAR
jgi:hypothetical protein